MFVLWLFWGVLYGSVGSGDSLVLFGYLGYWVPSVFLSVVPLVLSFIWLFWLLCLFCSFGYFVSVSVSFLLAFWVRWVCCFAGYFGSFGLLVLFVMLVLWLFCSVWPSFPELVLLTWFRCFFLVICFLWLFWFVGSSCYIGYVVPLVLLILWCL